MPPAKPYTGSPVAMAPDPPKEVAVYTVVSIVCEVVYDVC